MNRWALIPLLLLIPLLQPAGATDGLRWAGCGITRAAFMNEVAQAFQKESGIAITLTGGGATKGIREVAALRVELGGTCRHLILDDAEKGVKLHPVAWDALVVITHPGNPVDNITHAQLKELLTGGITSWQQLGGEDQPVELILRESRHAGVELMARELLFGDPELAFKPTRRLEESGPLELMVKETAHAVSISGVSSARRQGLKILTLDGVAPTQENIAAGLYQLFRPLYLVTPEDPSPEIRQFLAFIKSPRGQQVIAATGTVNLEQGEKLWEPYRQHMKQVMRTNRGIFE